MESLYEMVLGIWKLIQLAFYIVFSPAEEMCNLNLAQELASPQGQYKAIIYQYDCGATTPFTTNISILSRTEEIEYVAGNLFVAYHSSRSGPWHGPYTEIKWLSETSLVISYVADATVSKQEKSVGSVVASYVQLNSETANKAIKNRSGQKTASTGRANARLL